VVSFKSGRLFQKKRLPLPQYPQDTRLGEPQRRCGPCGEENIILPLQ
jgi:hypothetical protein